MDVKLKVIVGANAGQDVPVPAPKFFIGRAEDCQLRPKSDLISRHHCVLLVDPEMISIRDLGSRNGTYVNDQRVVGERALKPGDRVRVGPLEFEVHVEAEPVPAPLSAGKRPKVTSIREAVARTAQAPTDVADSDDVTKWLEEPAQATAETRPVGSGAAGGQTMTMPGFTFAPAPVAVPSPSTPPSSETSPVVEAAAPTVAQPPADAPPAKPAPKPAAKPSSNDSGKAAADTLRNFFRRR